MVTQHSQTDVHTQSSPTWIRILLIHVIGFMMGYAAADSKAAPALVF